MDLYYDKYKKYKYKYLQTNRIKLDVKQGDIIEENQILGEIILGSLSEIHLPLLYSNYIEPLNSEHVVAGKTVIAQLIL